MYQRVLLFVCYVVIENSDLKDNEYYYEYHVRSRWTNRFTKCICMYKIELVMFYILGLDFHSDSIIVCGT